MLARWHLLLGQFSVTFEYRPGAQHANADWMSRQCDQCRWPDCPVSMDLPDPTTSPYAIGLEMHWRVAYDQVRRHSGQAVRRHK